MTLNPVTVEVESNDDWKEEEYNREREYFQSSDEDEDMERLEDEHSKFLDEDWSSCNED